MIRLGMIAMIVCLLFGWQQMSAQSTQWNWASKLEGNSTSEVYPRGVETDNAGNHYVVGQFYGTINYSGGSVTSAGDADVFVAKFNSSGVLQWVVRRGSTLEDIGMDIDVSYGGDIYITGYESYTTSLNEHVAFVAKYNSGGTLQWSNLYPSYGPTEISEGHAVSLNIQESPSIGSGVFVTGFFSDSIDIGGTVLICNGFWDVVSGMTVTRHWMVQQNTYIAKLDESTGNTAWAVAVNGPYHEPSNNEGHGIVVDRNQDVYITGHFTEEAQFTTKVIGVDTISLIPLVTAPVISTPTVTLTSYSNTQDAYVAKLNGSNGSCIWAKSLGGLSNSDVGIDIDLSYKGDPNATSSVYALGEFTGDFIVGGVTQFSSTGNTDIFLCNLNASNGSYIAGIGEGGFDLDIASGLEIDKDVAQSIWITGTFRQAASFSGSSGSAQTISTFTSGMFEDDIYLAKYNYSLALQCLTSVDGTALGNGMLYGPGLGNKKDANDWPRLAGFFGSWESPDFNPHNLTTTTTGAGFLAQFIGCCICTDPAWSNGLRTTPTTADIHWDMSCADSYEIQAIDPMGNVAFLFYANASPFTATGLDPTTNYTWIVRAVCDGGGGGGTISGKKFYDLDCDGEYDLGEPGLAGWIIQLDNGMTAVTDAFGNYSISATPGTYVVSEVQQPGWTQTYPARPGTHTVLVGIGTTVTADFGNGDCPCPDCCDDFPKSLTNLNEQSIGSGVHQIDGNVEAGLAKVCKVTVTLLEAKINGQAVAGEFVSGGNTLGGVTGTIPYSHEVVWTGPEANVFLGASPFQLQLQFPQIYGTLEYCVRFSFTDQDCFTCDTVICFSTTQGMLFNGGTPNLSSNRSGVLAPVSGAPVVKQNDHDHHDHLSPSIEKQK
ncbi:MAG: hypothetical protein AB7H80_14120 [Candidatus Kapaibacterium sp.]